MYLTTCISSRLGLPPTDEAFYLSKHLHSLVRSVMYRISRLRLFWKENGHKQIGFGQFATRRSTVVHKDSTLVNDSANLKSRMMMCSISGLKMLWRRHDWKYLVHSISLRDGALMYITTRISTKTQPNSNKWCVLHIYLPRRGRGCIVFLYRRCIGWEMIESNWFGTILRQDDPQKYIRTRITTTRPTSNRWGDLYIYAQRW